MAIQDTDAFLVERGNVNYQTPAYNLMAIQDTDLLAVNRGGTNYKVTGLELKDYKGPQVVIYSPGQGEVMTQSSFTIYSSVWYSTSGITHVSSTWELALGSDPTFSNPVKQNVNSTSDLTSWYVTELLPGTSYFVRVTYNLSNSSSVISNTVLFSLSAGASPFAVTPPSSLVSSTYGTTDPVNQYVSPVALHSLRYPGSAVLLGTTLGGRTISFSLGSATSVGTGQLNTTPLPDGDIAYDAFGGSDSNNTYYINQGGLIKKIGIPYASLPISLTSQRVVTISPYDQFGSVCIRTESDEIWVVTGPGVATGGAGDGTIPTSPSSYTQAWTPTDSTNFTAPSGEKPIKVIGYFGNYVVWLTDAKNAYLTAPLRYASNNAAPVPSAALAQGGGATRANPVKIRPYPFGSAPDYEWEDIFSADLQDFTGAVTTMSTYGFWGYLTSGKVKGTLGWATSSGPGETGGQTTSLNATDGGFFGDKVILGVTGTWGFNWDGTPFGAPGMYYYDSSGNVYYTTSFSLAGTQATVDVTGVGPYTRTQPLASGSYYTNFASFKYLQTKPVDQS
jgi:hypothetical protein